MLVFEDTVSALCYTVIREMCRPPASDEDFPQNRVVGFVLGQHGRMPWFTRTPVFALTVAFGVWSLVGHGGLFPSLGHEARARQWTAWKNSPLRCCRDLMKFYESLVVFAWFSYRSADATTGRVVRPVGPARTAA